MLDIVIIGAFLLLILAVGVYKGRNITSMKDFAIGSQEYATPVLVATIFATMVGGATTIGFAEKAFSAGIIFIAATTSIALSYIIIAKFVSNRVELLQGALSTGDLLGIFFGKQAKVFTGIMAIIFLTGILGAQIISLGYCAEVLLGIPYEWGLLFSATIIILYSGYGGIAAVTATDVIQFGVLIIALPILCSSGIKEIGGYTELFSRIPNSHKNLFSSSSDIINYISLFFFWLIPSMHPPFIQRLLMAKDAKQIRSSMYSCAMIYIPFTVIVGFIGLIALANFPDIKSSLALPTLVNQLLPAGFKGLVVAGMFSVVMSTVDSGLNAASIAFSHDVVQPLRKTSLTDSQELKLTRMVTFVIGCLAVVAALTYRNVLDLVIGISSIWTPVILAPLFLGLAGFRATSASFLKAVIAGLGTYILWSMFLEPKLGAGGLVPGFIVNGLAIYFLSYKREKLPKIEKFNKKKKQQNDFFSEENLLGGVQKATLWQKFNHLVNTLVHNHNPPYFLFAVFTMINFLLPYFMWFDHATGNFDLFMSFRVAACVLCLIIMMHEFWPVRARKYMPLFWLCTITFCYPFATSYFLLDNGLSFFALLNISLILFVLILTLEWRLFIASLLTGFGAAMGLYLYNHGGFYFELQDHAIYYAIYTLIFSIVIGATFSRRKAYIESEKVDAMRAMGGMIAHELRTPIATMLGGTSGIRSTATDVPGISAISDSMETAGNQALLTIDMFLVRLKNHNKGHLETETLDSKQILEEIISNYPFSSSNQGLVSLDLDDNFTFEGNKILFQHVIYNLMSNALYQIKKSRKGEVLIQTKVIDNYRIIRFRDTVGAMNGSIRPYIFDKFFTNKDTGTGLGLPFCRTAMEQMGGTLECDFETGKFTDFILVFKG